MRKVIIVILVFIKLAANAQYFKMPLDTNHYWRERYSSTQFENGSLVTRTCDYQYNITKDTVINALTYKKVVLRHNICEVQPLVPQTSFLRQDTIAKRIIMRYNNQEYILYNFNKSAGDTAKLFNQMLTPPVSTYTVNTRDSVLLNDGYYHKRLLMDGSPNYSMIEGIGGEYGLVTPNFIGFGVGSTLQCMGKTYPSQSTIYHLSGTSFSCDAVVNVRQILNEIPGLFIFPNPTSDILNIKTENVIPKSIEIKNILGQIILNMNNINRDISTINIQDFSPGIYFIKVKLADKNISGHFIKN